MRSLLAAALLFLGCGGDGSCTDGVRDNGESDVDCGGGCGACANGMACNGAGDCMSGLCTNQKCAAPSCSDGAKDGTETDVDCGGGACPGCAAGRACKRATDCASFVCTNSSCTAAPGCSDQMKDGSETDVDCGGMCPPCADGAMCLVPGDCASGACTGGTCGGAGDPCKDMMRDGDETDVDCGGATCLACADGKMCLAPGDCTGGRCANGICAKAMALTLDFAAPVYSNDNTGTYAVGLAIADFNGDKKNDFLAIYRAGKSMAYLHPGNGNGTFGAPLPTVFSGDAYFVSVADFNRDGIADATTGSVSNQVNILLGAANGPMTVGGTFDSGLIALVVVAGDFNADNKPDVLVGNSDVNQVLPGIATLWVGKGDGTFTKGSSTTIGLNPSNLGVVGDFNHDGKVDAAFACVGDGMGNNGSLSVLLGNNNGTFHPSVETAASHPAWLVGADLDGDQRTDLVYRNYDGMEEIDALVGNGNGSFKPTMSIPNPNQAAALALADFDLDGKIDLAVEDDKNLSVIIYLGKGDGTFQPGKIFGGFSTPQWMVAGDLDADGKPDLVVSDTGGQVGVVMNRSK